MAPVSGGCACSAVRYESTAMDVWTSDTQPWDQMNPALQKFETDPPQAPPQEAA